MSDATIRTVLGDYLGADAAKKEAVVNLYGEISDWDVSNVTDMSFLFMDNTAFNQDISAWDVSSVTNMIQTFNFTIAPVNGITTTPSQAAVQSSIFSPSFFTEDFNGGIGAWTTNDSDGDDNDWSIHDNSGVGGSGCAQSESWNGNPLTPDNWLISPAIDLSTAGTDTILDFYRKAQDQSYPTEKYTVYLSNSGNTVADFTGANGSVIQAQETVIADGWQKKSVSLAAHVGGTVYIAFRHHDSTDMFKLNIDNIDIYACPAPTAQATSAVFGSETSSTLNLTSFTAPAGGATGYAIYINDTNTFTAPTDGDEPVADLTWNGSGRQPVYFGTSSSPNITVSDLDPGTTYYFQIYAYNDCLGTETYETTGLNSNDTTSLRVLTITGLTGNNKVYDDTTAATATGTAALSGIIGADVVSLGASPVYTFASANVGTGITINTTGYTISGTDSGKYTLTQPTLSGDITAAPLTVTASDQTKVYGKTDPTLTYSITGFVNGDDESDLDTGVSISRATGEAVGTYTITPSAATDSNYAISFVTADFSITAAPLTVTASDQTKVYGTTDPTLTYSITGFVNGDDEADLDTGVSISRAAGEAVGTYTITPSAATDSNYAISFVTADFSITAAPLTVTASDQTKVYGTTDPTLTYSITGFVNGDDESDLDTGVSISRAAGEAVGTYTITPSAATDSNYAISFVTADFSITAAPLTVTASDQTKVYGATDPTLTYSITGFQGTDTEADLDTGVSISRAAGETVGTYTITPSGASDSNYAISFVTADFSITAAPLTVTASDQTKVYGATDPTLTYSITGFVNGRH